MRFDYTALAAGLIGGFAMFVSIALLSDFHGMGRANWCEAAEAPLVCLREWADVAAIVGAFATVFFVLHQVRVSDLHHQQNVDLQTLKTRALFNRVVASKIEPLERLSLRLEVHIMRRDLVPVSGNDAYAAMVEIADLAQSAHDALQEYDDGTIYGMLTNLTAEVSKAQKAIVRGDGYGNFAPVSEVHEDAAVDVSLAADTASRFAAAFRAQFPTDSGMPLIHARRSSLSWLFTD